MRNLKTIVSNSNLSTACLFDMPTFGLGEGLCCFCMTCNVCLLMGFSMYFSEASDADGPNVFDDSNWQNMEGGAGVMIDVEGTALSMTLPMAMEVALSGTKHE